MSRGSLNEPTSMQRLHAANFSLSSSDFEASSEESSASSSVSSSDEEAASSGGGFASIGDGSETNNAVRPFGRRRALQNAHSFFFKLFLLHVFRLRPQIKLTDRISCHFPILSVGPESRFQPSCPFLWCYL